MSSIFSAVSGGDSDADAGDGDTLPGDTNGWGMRADSEVDFAAAVAGRSPRCPSPPMCRRTWPRSWLAIRASPRTATLTFTLAHAIPTLLEMHHALTFGLGGDALVAAAALSPATHRHCGCGRRRLGQGVVCWWLRMWP